MTTSLSAPSSTGEWWRSFYDDTPFELYLRSHRQVDLDQTIAFLSRHLKLKAGDTVFDQCCGMGTISIPLAEQFGLTAVGVDLCKKYIDQANADATKSGCGTFHVGDAFQFVAGPAANAAFNWYTSFGYDHSDARNKLMLDCAFRSLKPGGKFALDYPNMVGLMRNFKPTIINRLPSEAGEILLIRESDLDIQCGLLKQNWTFVMPDYRRLFHNTTLRIYLPHTLSQLLEQSGFVDVQFFGGLNDEPLRLDSPRLITVARRPA